MKRIVFLVIAVVLIAGAVGGFAYAQSQPAHEPVMGQKLIGCGALSVFYEVDQDTLGYSRFLITNPDCIGNATNIQICIISDNGTVYEGKLISPLTEPTEVTWLGPHQCGVIDLISCVYTGTNLLELQAAAYTVEVTWTGAKGALPLIGWSWFGTATFQMDANNQPFLHENQTTSALTQMVNMTQVLTKGK
jgi:hypothetical protein